MPRKLNEIGLEMAYDNFKDRLNSLCCPALSSGDPELMRPVITELVNAIAWGIATASSKEPAKAQRYLVGIKHMLDEEVRRLMSIPREME